MWKVKNNEILCGSTKLLCECVLGSVLGSLGIFVFPPLYSRGPDPLQGPGGDLECERINACSQTAVRMLLPGRPHPATLWHTPWDTGCVFKALKAPSSPWSSSHVDKNLHQDTEKMSTAFHSYPHPRSPAGSIVDILKTEVLSLMAGPCDLQLLKGQLFSRGDFKEQNRHQLHPGGQAGLLRSLHSSEPVCHALGSGFLLCKDGAFSWASLGTGAGG